MHGEGPRLKAAGGQGTRGAHLEHGEHAPYLGRVEAERLVERRRGLPSRKTGMRRGKRCGPGGVWALRWWRRNRHALGWPESRLEVRARAERTRNILYMSMTLDVSKLSGWLNDTAPCRESKGGHAT